MVLTCTAINSHQYALIGCLKYLVIRRRRGECTVDFKVAPTARNAVANINCRNSMCCLGLACVQIQASDSEGKREGIESVVFCL